MTQGRKADPAASSNSLVMDHAGLANASQAMTELAQRSAEIALRFDDGMPYDRNRMVSEARFYMGQSAEAMLEAGKRLIVLKENEQHGDFQEILEGRLGMNARTAQKLMSAAVKYLSPALASNASALTHLGKTKMLELVTEDDADLADLAKGGTVAGLSLDDMQSMTSRELRAALVEARKTNAAKDKVIAGKDEKLNHLAEAEERRRSASRDEREQAALAELRDGTTAVEAALMLLLSRVDEVMSTPPTEACSLAARQALDYVARRLVDAATQRSLVLDLETDVTPAHMQMFKDLVLAGRAAGKPGSTN